jgi:hypothetical protein
MGPIYDRSLEHLGAVDVGIIHLRQRLLEAIDACERGEPLPGLDESVAFAQIRSHLKVMPREVPWHEVDTHASEDLVPDYALTLLRD